MRIAILGTRGIPANYGGFETFAEELSTRLAARGHEVVVYCRERHDFSEYRGVRLVSLPTIRHKYFDTLAHTFLSTLHLMTHRVDAALYCNAANAVFTILPRLCGMPGRAERRRHRTQAPQMERIREGLVPDVGVSRDDPANRFVTDAQAIREYYKQRYGKDSLFIPYGAEAVAWKRRRRSSAGPRARPILPLCEPDGTGKSRARGPAGF